MFFKTVNLCCAPEQCIQKRIYIISNYFFFSCISCLKRKNPPTNLTFSNLQQKSSIWHCVMSNRSVPICHIMVHLAGECSLVWMKKGKYDIRKMVPGGCVLSDLDWPVGKSGWPAASASFTNARPAVGVEKQ